MHLFRPLRRSYFSVLFLGSDHISVEVCKALQSSAWVRKLHLLTPKYDSELYQHARRENLTRMVPVDPVPRMLDWSVLQGDEFWSHKYDWMVVASFGYLVPKRLINSVGGALNVHPSLLPKYQGASPIPRCIANQDAETGVSIITLSPKKFDKGLIVNQQVLPNYDRHEATFSSLSLDLARLGGELVIKSMVNFKKLEKTSQDPSQVVLAPKLPKDFGRLSISMDLETMYARYRACVGTRNKVWFSFRGKNMLITGMRRVTEDEERRLAAYKNACLGTIWGIFPGLTKAARKATKFSRKIDPVLYVKAWGGWLAITDMYLESTSPAVGTMRAFFSAHADKAIYTSRQWEKETGYYLKFD